MTDLTEIEEMLIKKSQSKRVALQKVTELNLKTDNLITVFIAKSFHELFYSYYNPLLELIPGDEIHAVKASMLEITLKNSSRIIFRSIRDHNDALRLAGLSIDVLLIHRIFDFDEDILSRLYYHSRSTKEGFPEIFVTY